ncbi:hypothetical protein AB0O01_13015 [Streptomyces sp. NPDC093252]|uniref:hypothetical protein n=1 Tax=Streptomyces sp. NPDC093252 TaxID=3154980 RepID=UPI00343D0CA4
MGAYEDFGKRLGYAEENISSIKAELVTVAHSTNIVKPEINGMVTEFVAANFGLKLFNMEKTLFDVGEYLDAKKGLDALTLKKRIDKILGDSGADDGGFIADHERRIKKAQETADQARRIADGADEKAKNAGTLARDAHRKLNTMATGVQREGRAPATSVGSVRELRDAATAINQLENRVNRLVAALA